MKNTQIDWWSFTIVKLQAISRRLIAIIALVVVIGFSMSACGGGEKSITSADALKAYLDSQSANSPDKPIKVAMKINENMVEDIKKAINSAGKYVSLNLTGSPLTTIPDNAFRDCELLVGITIPNSVISIGNWAFSSCTSLTNVTISNSVTSIGEGVFAYCERLTDITIPNSGTSSNSKIYKIGDKGPGGGTVFYTMDFEYKECSGELGYHSWYTAIEKAQNYDGGGFQDWRLPTEYELDLMYVNLKKRNLGDFDGYYYWSSSLRKNVDDDLFWNSPQSSSAWYKDFIHGDWSFTNVEDSRGVTVRAVRDF